MDKDVSRFTGSVSWQAYFVEWTIVAIVFCVFAIRGFKCCPQRPSLRHLGHPDKPLARVMAASQPRPAIIFFAGAQIAVSMVWFIVIAQQL